MKPKGYVITLLCYLSSFLQLHGQSASAGCTMWLTVKVNGTSTSYYGGPAVDTAHFYVYPWDSVTIIGRYSTSCNNFPASICNIYTSQCVTSNNPWCIAPIMQSGYFRYYFMFPFPKIIHIQFLNPTGIAEADDTQFTVCPNPAKDEIRVNSPEAHYDIMLLNNKGELLKSIKSQDPDQPIDIRTFSSGTYYVIIRSSGKTFAKKIIKI